MKLSSYFNLTLVISIIIVGFLAKLDFTKDESCKTVSSGLLLSKVQVIEAGNLDSRAGNPFDNDIPVKEKEDFQSIMDKSGCVWVTVDNFMHSVTYYTKMHDTYGNFDWCSFEEKFDKVYFETCISIQISNGYYIATFQEDYTLRMIMSSLLFMGYTVCVEVLFIVAFFVVSKLLKTGKCQPAST